ncbi:hypothetical protein GCM10023084_69920 [Streptomyces lacrimifluminis]
MWAPVITNPLRELSEAYTRTARTTLPTAPAGISGRRPIPRHSDPRGRCLRCLQG